MRITIISILLLLSSPILALDYLSSPERTKEERISSQCMYDSIEDVYGKLDGVTGLCGAEALQWIGQPPE